MGKLSLADFRAHVTDFARPNRFEVEILPSAAYVPEPSDRIMTTWLAESASIPSRSQGEVKIKFHGMEATLPGDYAKENLTILFYFYLSCLFIRPAIKNTHAAVEACLSFHAFEKLDK